MTKDEEERKMKISDEIAIETVQKAIANGFSFYDIQELTRSILCLAKFQKIENRVVDTEGLPLVWKSF